METHKKGREEREKQLNNIVEMEKQEQNIRRGDGRNMNTTQRTDVDKKRKKRRLRNKTKH